MTDTQFEQLDNRLKSIEEILTKAFSGNVKNDALSVSASIKGSDLVMFWGKANEKRERLGYE